MQMMANKFEEISNEWGLAKVFEIMNTHFAIKIIEQVSFIAISDEIW